MPSVTLTLQQLVEHIRSQKQIPFTTREEQQQAVVESCVDLENLEDLSEIDGKLQELISTVRSGHSELFDVDGEKVRVYRQDTHSTPPPDEALISIINYFRSALLIANESDLPKDKRKAIISDLKSSFLEHYKLYLRATSEKDKYTIATLFAGEIEDKFKTHEVDINQDDLNKARECIYMLVEPESALTLVTKNQKVYASLTRPLRVPEARMKEEIPESEIELQNKPWFKLANARQRAYFLNFFQKYRDKIIEFGNSASPAGRFLPWLSNFKKEERLIGELDEASEKSETDKKSEVDHAPIVPKVIWTKQYRTVRHGVLCPYSIHQDAIAIDAARKNIIDLIKTTLEQAVRDYLEEFAPLYDGMEKPTLDFPIHLKTLLSPLVLADTVCALPGLRFITRKMGFQDNNYYYLQLIEQALGQDLEDAIDQMKIDHKGKTYSCRPQLLHTNRPINSKHYLSLTQNRDIDDAQKILNSAADEMNLLADKIARSQFYDQYYKEHKSEYKDALKQFSLWLKGKKKLSIETLQMINEITDQLKNPDFYNRLGLSRIAANELRDKIHGSMVLKKEISESFLAKASRRLCNLPYIGWVFSIPIKIVKFFVPGIYNCVTKRINHPQLKIGVAEAMAIGSKGVVNEACKSTRERAGFIGSCKDAVMREPGLIMENSEESILDGGRTVMQEGHAFHGMTHHPQVVKTTVMGLGKMLDGDADNLTDKAEAVTKPLKAEKIKAAREKKSSMQLSGDIKLPLPKTTMASMRALSQTRPRAASEPLPRVTISDWQSNQGTLFHIDSAGASPRRVSVSMAATIENEDLVSPPATTIRGHSSSVGTNEDVPVAPVSSLADSEELFLLRTGSSSTLSWASCDSEDVGVQPHPSPYQETWGLGIGSGALCSLGDNHDAPLTYSKDLSLQDFVTSHALGHCGTVRLGFESQNANDPHYFRTRTMTA